jgi:hypothetical protein
MTHLVAFADGVLTESVLIVERPAAQLSQFHAAQLSARGIQQSGSVSTSYASDPNQIETAIDLTRTEGEHTASVSLAVDNGYGYGALNRRTTLPRASVRFLSPTTSVTFLDADVKGSPLAFEGIRLRGVHVDTNTWFVHAGIASLTNFRQRLYEEDPDRAAELGYRFSLSKSMSITPSFEWITASRQYVSGRSGAISAMKFEYARPDRIRLRVQGGITGRGAVGVASDIEYLGKDERLQGSVRSTPIDFPGLSMSRARGFEGAGSWTRRLTNALTVDTSGVRDVYSLSDGTSQSSSNWDSRLQWRVRHFSLNGGYAGSNLSRRNAPALTSASIPVGAGFESRIFGNSFQYRFSRNGVTDSGSHSMRDSAQIKLHSLTLTAFVSRQTQAPTLDYVLGNLPWLRDALLSSGVSVSTPEEVQQFINSHADLIAAGYLRNFSLNVSPVHSQVGASASWSARKNVVSARFEWRTDDDARLIGHIISQYESGSINVRLGRATELSASGSFFSTQLGNVKYHQPAYNFTVRRRIGAVPSFFNRLQQHASIHGIVFADATGRGEYDSSSKGLKGVTVILDGYRRMRTNRFGYYSFGAVPKGEHSVEIQYNSDDPYLFTSAPAVSATENSTINFGIGEQRPRLFGSVFNDAGVPIPNVVLRVSGSESHQISSGREGSFSLILGNPGEYTVSLDPASLPPAYSLDDIKPQKLQLQRGRPMQSDFTVQALRSIAGHVSCDGKPASIFDLNLTLFGPRLNPVYVKLNVDESGNYIARGLASGQFQLVLKCGASEVSREIEVGADPAAVGGVDLRVARPSRK